MPTARKFSDEDKIEMVKMLISGATQRAVSTKFNYAQSRINCIQKQKQWLKILLLIILLTKLLSILRNGG